MEIRRKIEEKASSHPFGPVITGKKNEGKQRIIHRISLKIRRIDDEEVPDNH
jgi:hypothetical protein